MELLRQNYRSIEDGLNVREEQISKHEATLVGTVKNFKNQQQEMSKQQEQYITDRKVRKNKTKKDISFLKYD